MATEAPAALTASGRERMGGREDRRYAANARSTLAVPEKIFQLATLLVVMYNPSDDEKFGPPHLPSDQRRLGRHRLRDRSNDKLDAEQKLCQKATGLLTWICQVRHDVMFYARKCSRVMSAPKAAQEDHRSNHIYSCTLW